MAWTRSMERNAKKQVSRSIELAEQSNREQNNLEQNDEITKSKLWYIFAVMTLLIFLACYNSPSVPSTDLQTTGYYTDAKVVYKNNQAINCTGEPARWEEGDHDCLTESNELIRVYLERVDFIVTSDTDDEHLNKATYSKTSMQVSIAGMQIPCQISEQIDCFILVGSMVDKVPNKYRQVVLAPLPKTYSGYFSAGVLVLLGAVKYISQ